MEQAKKSGLTPLNWILCISGILFFMTFIVLPPMFRAFIKEEENLQNNNVGNNNNSEEPNSVVVKTTICIKNELGENEEYRIITEADKTKIIAYTNKSNDIIIFDSCEQEVANFVNVEGLYNSCEIVDNKKIITHRITLEKYSEPTSPLPFDYKLSSQEITNYLTSNSFNCSEATNEQ